MNMQTLRGTGGANFGAATAAPIVISTGDAKRLQYALAGLGQATGSLRLAVPITGYIDAATVASVNWAFTNHIGAGQAPAYLRTGALTANDIAQYILEINSFIIDEIIRRGKIPPFTAVPPLPSGTVQTDAYTAINIMTSRYKLLTAIAGVLIGIEKTGRLLPCKLVSTYNQLVYEYRAFGQSLFDSLGKQGARVHQVAYRDGQPVKNANGEVQTYQITAPLLPPNFVRRASCPGMVTLQGGLSAPMELGIAPLIIYGVIAIAGAAGAYFSVQALREFKVIVRGPIRDTAQELEAFTSCVAKLRAQGASADAAISRCEANIPSVGLGLWSWVGIGAALVVVGGVTLYYLQRRGTVSLPERGAIPQAEMTGWNGTRRYRYMR